MSIETQVSTAAECAGNLVAALTEGSSDGIRRAFDEALLVASEPCWDTLEEEYRDMLAGVLGAMPTGEHNHAVVVRLLRHVAASSSPAEFPRLTASPVRFQRPETLACGLC